MDRKILIVNDDGILADGLKRLAVAAKPFGEVWVVAPDDERSASSHRITLQPLDIFPTEIGVDGIRAYSCSGTPADCVRAGALGVMPEKPDLVLSGINHGYNVATDIQYSGTDGAAFEAAFQEIHAIAFSEGMSDCHEVTDRYLSQLLGELIDKPLPDGCIWNVNFPECPLSECKGILYDRKVSRSMFYQDQYPITEKLENGGFRVSVKGIGNTIAEEGSDMRAVVDNFVSVGTVRNVGY